MSMDYFILQTDKFNPKLNMPLELFTYTRDMTFGDAIGMGETTTSFLRTTRNAQGSTQAQGMPWLADGANTAPTANIDNQRVINKVRNLGHIIKVDLWEIERSKLTGADVVTGKMTAMQKAYQFNADQYTYLGSSDVGAEGLLNRTDVAVGNVPHEDWINATPDEIIYDFTEMLTALNSNAGYAVYANRILLPFTQWNYVYSTPRSSISDTSILAYILKNNVSSANGAQLQVYPCKWLDGQGVDGTQRMIAYNVSNEYVRLPLFPLQPYKAVEYEFGYNRSYIYRFGELELVYPETVIYRDGI